MPLRKNIFVSLIFSKKSSKILLFFYFLFSIFSINFSKAENNHLSTPIKQKINIEYIEPSSELEDYIIDSGDTIYLEFFPASELTGFFPVNKEGELLLPRLDETYVRGLTTSELIKLLEKRYEEFLIEPQIRARIAVFKQIRVLVRGELKYPGIYKFPSYGSAFYEDLVVDDKSNFEDFNRELKINQNSKLNMSSFENITIKRKNENTTTISDVIRKAGGITSKTDLSRIEIIRDVPIGKGGGKKRALIDLSEYLNESNATNDIRLFDGDSLFFPKLSKSNQNQISKSILTGISPKFISVNLFGRVENPGSLKLPLEASLSDAIDLSGPIKPLSGKIVLIRYQNDGTVVKKNISYSARAKRGSRRNPILMDDDFISVKNSIVGKTSEVLKEVTSPFIGIYTTKELLEGLGN